MNALESTILESMLFVSERYMLGAEVYQPKKEIQLPEETEIVELFSNPLCLVADEVLYFFLSVNKIQRKYGASLMSIPGNDFFPLFPFWLIYPGEVDEVIYNYCYHHENAVEDYQNLIPIIHGDDRILFFTPILKAKAVQAPIYYKWGIDDPAELTLCYSSLTNLLLMVAECYETGAYYFQKSSIYGSWREDFIKSEPIFHKYHAGLPFRSPHELSHFLDDYQG
jgi:hypothetical protein